MRFVSNGKALYKCNIIIIAFDLLPSMDLKRVNTSGPVLQRVAIAPNQLQVLKSIASLQSLIYYVHSCD